MNPSIPAQTNRNNLILINAIHPKIRKEDFIEMFKSGLSVDVVNRLEGRFLMMLCDPFDYGVQVFSDRFGQFDCYHYINEEKTVISSDLSLFPKPPSNDGYDQVGLAHTLTVYGYRAAKKHTIYKNVNRLGIGEVVLVGSKKANIMQNKYKPINIEDYKMFYILANNSTQLKCWDQLKTFNMFANFITKIPK